MGGEQNSMMLFYKILTRPSTYFTQLWGKYFEGGKNPIRFTFLGPLAKGKELS
jgi:hypothetical protein